MMNQTSSVLGKYTQMSVIKNPVIRTFLYLIIELPLMAVYLEGPSVGQFGGWDGRPFYDICATLTNVPSSHWIVSRESCELLIFQRFESFLLLIYFMIYLILLAYVTSLSMGFCCQKMRRKAKRS